MITEPAKIFLPLVGLATVVAVVYSALTADPAGTALLAAVAVAAFTGALAVTVHRENELAPVPTADAGAPQVKPAPPTRLPGGPGWPALAGLGAGFAALALIAGPLYAIPAGALAAVAAVGWLASVSSDRTGRAPNLLPVGIPVVGLFAIFSLMFLMSRILLAVPEQASTAIALLVAVVIMAAASFIAVKPNVSTRTMLNSLVIGGVLMTGGGLVAAAAGQRHVEEHHHGPEPIEIAARDIKFNIGDFELPAETETAIKFENEDTVPHNISIYNNPDFRGLAVFQGAVITNDTIEYHFRTPARGTYYYRCDIHPAMQGKVNIA